MNPFFNWLKDTGTQAMLVLVGTVAAIVAALGTIYFGRKSLTKKDLTPLETHTAATSGHLQGVNAHFARLNEQAAAKAMLDGLFERAERVPITARGKGDVGTPLTMVLITNEPNVKFSRVDLLNLRGSLFGSAPCIKTDAPMQFSFVLDPDTTRKWLYGTETISGPKHLYLRVYMYFEGSEEEVGRQMCVISTEGRTRYAANNYLIPLLTLEGSV